MHQTMFTAAVIVTADRVQWSLHSSQTFESLFGIEVSRTGSTSRYHGGEPGNELELFAEVAACLETLGRTVEHTARTATPTLRMFEDAFGQKDAAND